MDNNHYTEKKFFGGTFPEPFRAILRQDMLKAYRKCDVIGITPEESKHRGKYYFMGAGMAFVESDAQLGSAIDPIDWHDNNMYEAMIHGKVTIVTCYDLKNKLEDLWRCEVNIHKINPPNRGITMHMAEYEEFLKIDAKGLYFVAWGLLGKAVCGHIKECGGQAVDIGAIIDGWAGQKTRSYHNGGHKL